MKKFLVLLLNFVCGFFFCVSAYSGEVETYQFRINPSAQVLDTYLDVAVYRVESPHAEDVDRAIGLAVQALRKTSDEAPRARFEVLEVADKGTADPYFGESGAALRIARAMGWREEHVMRLSGLNLSVLDQTPWLRELSLKKSSVTFVGPPLSPEERSTQEGRKNKNTPLSWSFIVLRAVIDGVVTFYGAIHYQGYSASASLAVGTTAGILVLLEGIYYSKMNAFVTKKGFFPPSRFKEAGFIESFFVKEYSLHFLYLASLQMVAMAMGASHETLLSAVPAVLWAAVNQLWAEGTWEVAQAKLVTFLQDQMPKYESQLNSFGKAVTLAVSATGSILCFLALQGYPGVTDAIGWMGLPAVLIAVEVKMAEQLWASKKFRVFLGNVTSPGWCARAIRPALQGLISRRGTSPR